MTLSSGTIYGSIWCQVLIMSVDPHPEVASNASMIVDYVHEVLVNSPLGHIALGAIDDLLRYTRRQETQLKRTPSNREFGRPLQPGQQPQTPPTLEKHSSYLTVGSLKRAGSSLRNLAFGTPSDASFNSQPSTITPPATKPQQPVYPTNTPRGRLPSEWSRPPEMQTSQVAGAYHAAPTPHAAGFTPTKIVQPVTDKDAKAQSKTQQARPIIPLRSNLLEWSTEYFREPQMRAHDPDEPGSADYNQRLWRRTRNEKIIAESQPLKSAAGSSKWTRLEGFISNGLQPMKMTFHQFDDHLCVADERDTV